jgi:hypothetical protein
MMLRIAQLAFIVLAPLHAASVASAETLQPSADAPAWAYLGVDLLLFLHIGGGALGIASGVVASLSRKGAQVHRIAGRVFFLSMATCYLIAAGIAPFLVDEQRTNTVAAVFALYLLFTGVQAARVRTIRSGFAAQFGLLVAGSVTGLGILFAVQGANHPTGTLDGSPPEAFITFIIGGVAATVGEVRLLIGKQLSGRSRVVRHLWRMCASFFYASGSFFVGQPQVFPDWFNETPLPSLFAFFPLLVMLASLWAYRRRRRGARAAARLRPSPLHLQWRTKG